MGVGGVIIHHKMRCLKQRMLVLRIPEEERGKERERERERERVGKVHQMH